MNKIYDVFLDGNKIGTSKLEHGDAPMGVAFGQIRFIENISGYEFFSKYCLENKIEFEGYPEDKLIMTCAIPGLKVIDEAGIEINGIGTSISGMDSDTFEITILGISYPFYQEEFPEQVKAYYEK
jgi:hypothetical protein